jgi:hypothetical protein
LGPNGVEAHGGWRHWQEIRKLTAHVSVRGGLLQAKGKGDALADVHIAMDPHRQHVERWPFGAPGQHSVYEPQRTAIVTDAGEIVEARETPRSAFAGQNYASQWDHQQLIYFSGYALWTYLTTPFLFKLPGFRTEEIEPWEEGNEIWRRLKVNFPAHVHSHSSEQTLYFDATGILRRHDYSVDVVGGTKSANYAFRPQPFGGIVYPTQRRVYVTGPDNRPQFERVVLSIDVHRIEMAQGQLWDDHET